MGFFERSTPTLTLNLGQDLRKKRGLLVQVFTSKVILGKDWASGLHSASKRKVLGPEGLVGMDW